MGDDHARLTPDEQARLVVWQGNRAWLRMEDGHYAVVPATHSIKSLKGVIPRPKRPVGLDDMQAAIGAGATGE